MFLKKQPIIFKIDTQCQTESLQDMQLLFEAYDNVEYIKNTRKNYFQMYALWLDLQYWL
jgi:hypothetical protein